MEQGQFSQERIATILHQAEKGVVSFRSLDYFLEIG